MKRSVIVGTATKYDSKQQELYSKRGNKTAIALNMAAIAEIKLHSRLLKDRRRKTTVNAVYVTVVVVM